MVVLPLGRPKWVIRDPLSQHFNKLMRLNADNFSWSVYSLIMYISCIMQHVNNMLIPLRFTRKENNWETEETLERAAVTLETEWAKWPNPWCLWRWWWWWWCVLYYCHRVSTQLQFKKIITIIISYMKLGCASLYKWAPFSTEWCVCRLWVEERSPVWRVAANILNKQSRTADKEWSFSLWVGRGANNYSP
jgi:hypothetical protein